MDRSENRLSQNTAHQMSIKTFIDLEKNTSSGFYLDNLTGIRALAVLWVLIFHTWAFTGDSLTIKLPWTDHEIGLTRLVRQGAWGVDIFFVLSGFLLTMPWIKNGIKAPTWQDSLTFYKRRLLRILPAFYFTLLGLIYILQYGLGPLPTPAQMLQHTLFINAWLDTLPLRGAFWSLPVEAHFYIFLPLFLLCAARVRSFVGFMTIVLSIAIFIRFLAFYSPLIEDKGKYIFSFFGFMDQFAIGSLFAYAFTKKPLTSKQGNILVILSIIFMIAFASFIGKRGDMFQNHDPIYPFHQTIIGLISGLLIYGAASKSKVAKLLFGNFLMIFIGIISYSMYLWHTVILDIFIKTNILHTHPPHERLTTIIAYTWPPIFTISILSYLLIERYFLKIRHDPTPGARSLPQRKPMYFFALSIITLMALTFLARTTAEIGM